MGLSDVDGNLPHEMQDTKHKGQRDATPDQDKCQAFEGPSRLGRHQSGAEPKKHGEQRH
jgi:hypothetical protein